MYFQSSMYEPKASGTNKHWSPFLFVDKSLFDEFLRTYSLNSKWKFEEGVPVKYQQQYSFLVSLHVPSVIQLKSAETEAIVTPGTRSICIRENKEWCAWFESLGGIPWCSKNDELGIITTLELFGETFRAHMDSPDVLASVMNLLESLEACKGLFGCLNNNY